MSSASDGALAANGSASARGCSSEPFNTVTSSRSCFTSVLKAAVVAACSDALIWEDRLMSRMLGGEFVVADVDARDRTYHLCRPEHLEIAKSMHEFWWPFVACVVLDPVPEEAEA